MKRISVEKVRSSRGQHGARRGNAQPGYWTRPYVLMLLSASFAAAQAPPSITEYSANQFPLSIAAGSDGALWYTEQSGIGRITTGGVVTDYAISGAMGSPGFITGGPDGSLWFTVAPPTGGHGQIGRITPLGNIALFPLPTPSVIPNAITTGPDGALWFTESGQVGAGAPNPVDGIGRVTAAGILTEFAIPTAGASPYGIAAGADGALWFTEPAKNKIGRITTAGAFTEYQLAADSSPSAIAAGPDGALWFTEAGGIGRITTSGMITTFAAAGAANGICVGPDGALWFTTGNLSMVGRITTAGTVAEYPVPSAGENVFGITSGADGGVWFTEAGVQSNILTPGKIGRVAVLNVGPVVSGAALPAGGAGVAYSAALGASGGTPPYIKWLISVGTLPPGLALNPLTGVISGTPTSVGTFGFDVTVQDSTGATSFGQTLSITVGQGICNYSTLGGGQIFTAAGGSGTISISAGANCTWSVTGAPAWVTIAGPSSGSGNGAVDYVVQPNSTLNSLDAVLTIVNAGLFFDIKEGAALLDVFPGIPEFVHFLGSMPHVAVDGGWTTTLNLVNKGGAFALARPSFFAPGGSPLAVPADFAGPSETLLTSSFDQTLHPNGLFVLDAGGVSNAPLLEGSAQLSAQGPLDGFAIFHFGPTSQEAAAPIEMRNSGAYVLAFDNTNGVLTGMAVANILKSGGSAPVTIRDSFGTLIGGGLIGLSGSGHTSFLLSAQFPETANLRGTIEIDPPSGGQISVVALRFTSPGTLAAIPALADVSAGGGSFAHLFEGGGWESTFVLVNAGAAAAQAQLNFFDDVGNPMSLPVSFPQNASGYTTAKSVTQSIAPNASLWIRSATSQQFFEGSARLVTNGSVSGYEIIRYDPTGQEAMVPLESRNAGTYLLAFDNTNGTATGFAISLVSAQATSIPIIVRDDTGLQVAAGSIPLAANGHSAQVLATAFPAAAGIRGSLEFDAPSGTQINVIGIRLLPAGTFTTLPVLAK